jgi:phospholipid/cholesterol/gamma-HCH transport system ATP-binding protein
MTPKIEIDGLKKSFGKNTVLDGVTLSLPKGESLVLIGGSGSGKSVLFKCILGLLTTDAGSVKIDGKEILGTRGNAHMELMRKFGVLFQAGALFDSLSVWENITFGARQLKHISPAQAKDLAVEKLAAVDLSADVINLLPAELSGGMQKRVALARAICVNPEIIFLDGPTEGLDPISADVINNIIINCTRKLGLTVLSITHDMASASKIADHVAMLYEGKIIWKGAAKDIYNSNNTYVDQFVHGSSRGPIKYMQKAA